MGREIRKVPPNWDHPLDAHNNLQPMFNQTFADAAHKWKEGLAAWERGERPEYCNTDRWKDREYWEYEGAPSDDRSYYRPWSDEEATWFQMWETVSEGTPVTPPFATPEELVNYLATKGTFWDRSPWKRENAEAFVKEGWAPSLIMAGGKIYEPKDGFPPT